MQIKKILKLVLNKFNNNKKLNHIISYQISNNNNNNNKIYLFSNLHLLDKDQIQTIKFLLN
jgi:hypothetical protein